MLQLDKGDLVKVVRKDASGWWFGANVSVHNRQELKNESKSAKESNGNRVNEGWFPSDFVVKLDTHGAIAALEADKMGANFVK